MSSSYSTIKSPNSGSNIDTGNLNWDDPMAIRIKETTTYANQGREGHSNLLFGSDFNFDLPYSARISGVKVTISKSVNDDRKDGETFDENVSLFYNETMISENKAYTELTWRPKPTETQYGDDGDTWNCVPALTPDIVNDASFGVILGAENNKGLSGAKGARVYYYEVTVYYDDYITAKPFAILHDTQVQPSGTTTGSTYILMGTTQQAYAANYGGLSWINGPNEYNRYIVVYGDNSYTYPTFWGVSSSSDNPLISLVQYLSKDNELTDISSCLRWLENNGYYTNHPEFG